MEYLSDSENEYPDNDIEEDIILNERFPPPCEYTKKHLLEYRIYLLTRIKIILEPGLIIYHIHSGVTPFCCRPTTERSDFRMYIIYHHRIIDNC